MKTKCFNIFYGHPQGEKCPLSLSHSLCFYPMGQRLAKIEKTKETNGDLKDEDDWNKTYYVRDAQGNVMAVYDLAQETCGGIMNPQTCYKVTLKEHHLYGSSRIGIKRTDALIAHTAQAGLPYDLNPIDTAAFLKYKRKLGLKEYELTNHLGNVMAVVTDRKITVHVMMDYAFCNLFMEKPLATYYLPDVISYSDYYPGGMLMPDRNDVVNSYRFSYQGSERTEELHENHYTTYFRELDTRILRWWSIDPDVSDMPWQSPYLSMDNNPILYNDPMGDKVKYGLEGGTKADRKRVKKQVNMRRKIDEEFNQQHKDHTGWKNRKKTLIYRDRVGNVGEDHSTVFDAVERQTGGTKNENVKNKKEPTTWVEWNINHIKIDNQIAFIHGSLEMEDDDSHMHIYHDGRKFQRPGAKVTADNPVIMNIALWLIVDPSRSINFEGNAPVEMVDDTRKDNHVYVLSHSWSDRNKDEGTRTPAQLRKSRSDLVYKSVKANLSGYDKKRITKSVGVRPENSVRVQKNQ